MTTVTCEKTGCSETFDPDTDGVTVTSVNGSGAQNNYYHSVAHVQ